MKKLTIIVFSLLISLPAFAQQQETLFGNNGLRFSGIWGGFTHSFAKFGDDFGQFSGGFGGLEFGNAVLIGWGGEKLLDDIRLDGAPDKDFDLKYNGFVLGYLYNSHNVVHPDFRLLIGGGKARLEGMRDPDKIFAIQPSLGAELNVFKWFHLGLRGGYTFITESDLENLSDSDLSSPFAQVSFKFGISWRTN